ncbi:MAG: glutamine-hydrolyzing carbamoyl-phosphate synthase small subunit [Nitrospirales bacterium]|nr:glutamine-hydrolyzing carbamoyl-phosphate synthase small subunit [Nitrospirales bacterium]
MSSFQPAILALSDGTIFRGRALGYYGEATGEVVFNTAMTGYQEILTDPSYYGQMVVMTCPHIGNYGIAEDDAESRRAWAGGFILKEATKQPSNWRATHSLHDYLIEHRIVGIEGIDTRALTRHLRDHGSQNGIISHLESDPAVLVEKAKLVPPIIDRDLVSDVTCPEPYYWKEGTGTWTIEPQTFASPIKPRASAYQIAVVDFGVKQNILRLLVDAGCDVTVVPATTSAENIRAMNPDGIVLSNGPGDPQGVRHAVPEIQKLIGWRPILGICLGHQILGIALNLQTYKLPFGHHGANHPVMDLRTQKVEITSQNHNFAVGASEDCIRTDGTPVTLSTPFGPFQITHASLNDDCIEGMTGVDVPVLSFQYHPEASPGPHDSSYLFHQFTQLMDTTHAM